MTPNINAILRNSKRSCTYGAPIGDSDMYDGSIRLHLQRIVFTDGDYGPDNTYWGASKHDHLWCAFNAENAEHAAGHGTRIYVRATTRANAKAAVVSRYVNTKFFR